MIHIIYIFLPSVQPRRTVLLVLVLSLQYPPTVIHDGPKNLSLYKLGHGDDLGNLVERREALKMLNMIDIFKDN